MKVANRSNACVLLLSGLDPSGGAGLAADQRAVLAAGAWPCPVAVVSTVQSTAGLESVVQVDPDLVEKQALRVLAHQHVRAVKTGALGGDVGIELVLRLLKNRALPLIVDPVLGPTKGRAALSLGNFAALFKRTTLLTPNAVEAEKLCGTKVRDIDDQRQAARLLQSKGADAVLVKGGHVPGPRCVDVLVVGKHLVEFGSQRRRVHAVHGTGCTLASLIAGRIAVDARTRSRRPSDLVIIDAVRFAKRRLTKSLTTAERVGRGLLVTRV